MKSINPFTEELIREYQEYTNEEVNSIINEVHGAWLGWKETGFSERAAKMKKLAGLLRQNKKELAALITDEMGKIKTEAEAEIEKCSWVCNYYADHAGKFLSDENISTDADCSYVRFEPLGIVLAIMPWNFPFWQVFRFAAPALMAGNAGLLKHASNVSGCALAIEDLFARAGFPKNIFRTLLIRSKNVSGVIDNELVKAVTLTGSEHAGSIVAGQSGKLLKKTVLELGGSDPFIVLSDADLEKAAQNAVKARMINNGQSCIAAKRFIVEESIAAEFEEKAKEIMASLQAGDPADEKTAVAPLARLDLLEDLESQVERSLTKGAEILTGGRRIDKKGYFFEQTILTNVNPDMPVMTEETFGPVMPVIRVKDEEEAVHVANRNIYGLGGSIFTRDTEKGERIARKIETGNMFINAFTKSDPRLPFGGVKKSGYGRELSHYGIKEFVNIKTVYIA